MVVSCFDATAASVWVPDGGDCYDVRCMAGVSTFSNATARGGAAAEP